MSGEDECDVDGDLRLVGGPNELEGRVEVCLDGVWRRWCSSTGTAVQVACKQLGFTDGKELKKTVWFWPYHQILQD